MTTIMLLEDDEMLAEGLRYALEKESYTVKRMASVKEARQLLEQETFDLLLLDVMLPDGSGFELCSWVRSTGSQVPVLFLTAYDDEVNVVQGLDLGGDDYITKPFRIKELVSRIKANLRRAAGTGSGGADNAIRSGGIVVYPLETRAMKGREALVLTPVEFKLLLLFIRHPRMTLSRSQLLDRLWDEHGGFVDDNTLSVNIRRLREKLEDDPSQPKLIVTVRGIGYRWEQESDAHA